VSDISGNDWKPYINTAPHTDYPSGSAVYFSAFANAALLIFQANNSFGFSKTYSVGSSSVEPGLTPQTPVTISAPTLTSYESDGGFARVLGGVHFTEDVTEAQRIGRLAAPYAFAKAQQLWQGIVSSTPTTTPSATPITASPSATPTSTPSSSTPTATPTAISTSSRTASPSSPNPKLCLYTTSCFYQRSIDNCQAGTFCSTQSLSQGQCLELPKPANAAANCVSVNNAVCSWTAPCCNPAATCQNGKCLLSTCSYQGYY